MADEPAKVKWERVGSVRVSRSGQTLVLVVRKERYVVNLADLRDVLDGKRAYAMISQPPAGD